MPFVYILKSQKNGKYYVGSTNNLERRLKEHNLGQEVWTKGLRPLDLMFTHKCSSLIEARRIEKKIKSWKRRDFIEKVIENQKLIIEE